MKVVYSVATKLGGSGIGNTAYQAVAGINHAGFLERVFCASWASLDLPRNLVSAHHLSFWEGLPFLPSAYRWLLKDLTHDLLTSLGLPQCDIFHVWNGHGLYSLKRAKTLGAKIVVERASSHPLTFSRLMNQEYLRRGLKFNQMLDFNRRRLLQEFEETDYITVPSDFAYQSMIENGIPKQKLVQIPFGVDLEKFRPLASEVNPPAGGQTFNVLFVGQVGLRKGVLYLLEAWQKLKLPSARLTIVGQADWEIRKFLKPFVSDRSIVFKSFSPTLPLYQQSHLFVLPSLEEGSALVNYEALACGLPVITTWPSGSVVSDGQEGYLVPPGNAEALAEKIKKLYESSSLRKQMGAAARITAEKYSWRSYGEKLVDFYRRLCL